MMKTVTLVVVMMFVDGCVSEDIIDLTQEKYNQSFWQQRIFFHTPIFKMKHRKVTYSSSGHLDTITLIFQTSKPFHVRWFRKVPNEQLSNSEVAYKLPVEGDPNFEKWVMRSGSLWATKLKVVGRCVSRDFETIVSSADGTFQYRIGTKVEAWSNEKSHDQEIEAPDWLVGGEGEVLVREGGKMALSCAALVSEERSGFTDELILLQESEQQLYQQLNNTDSANSYLHPPQQKHLLKLKCLDVFSTHKDAKGGVEKHGTNLLSGKRLTLYNESNDVVYQVGLTASNVSASHAGKYMCCFDRKDDRLLLLTRVRVVKAGGGGEGNYGENGGFGGRFEEGLNGSGRRNNGFGGRRSRFRMGNLAYRPSYAIGVNGTYPNSKTRTKIRRKYRKKNRRFSKSYREFSHSQSDEDNDIQVELLSCERGGLVGEVWMVKKEVSTCVRCRGKMGESAVNGGGGFEVGLFRDDIKLEAIFGIKSSNYKLDNQRRGNKGRRYLVKLQTFSKNKRIRKRRIKQTFKKNSHYIRKLNQNRGDDDEDEGDENIEDLLGNCNKNNNYNNNPNNNKNYNNNFRCMGLYSFINVADGGVYESTLTLHNPHPTSFPPSNHIFTCRAYNSTHHKSVNFKLKYF